MELNDAGGGYHIRLELPSLETAPSPGVMGRLRHTPLQHPATDRLCMTSLQHDLASPPRSPAIPDAVLRIYEEQYITKPLLAALRKLQDQLQAAGTTEAPPKRAPYAKTPELAWGRLSPQLTPTPSPSPPPKRSYRSPPSFPTPPETSPQRGDSASASPIKHAAAARKSRRRQSSSSIQPSSTMLRRSRARESRATERQFWELDASGRRAKRVVGG